MSGIIIALLGINLIFSPNISNLCDNSPTAQGCYNISENAIYISEDLAEEDSQRVLSHELGHALFYGNEEPKSLVRMDLDENIPDQQAEEIVADLFADYLAGNNNDELGEKFPSLCRYFEECLGLFSYFYSG